MNARKKVMFVFGTRPEAIKLAPVVREIRNKEGQFDCSVVTTGQHREMLDQVLDVFGIKPDHDLNIMQENQPVEAAVIRCLEKLPPVMAYEKPDIVLVQGDTSTTFAASLVAYYHKIPVGHVEAGLRTFDKYRPFPEEINRKLTTAIADLHFAPTKASKDVLIRENVPPGRIFMTGNTVIDALLGALQVKCDLGAVGIRPTGRKIILVTTHRRESFGKPLEGIFLALNEIAMKYPKDVEIIFPVHRNPLVRKPAKDILKDAGNVHLLDPLDYLSFVHLMKISHLILTDSGGIQEEAPSLSKPVLVLRDVTERPEGVAAGCVKLVGTDTGRIVSETSKLIENAEEYERMSGSKNPYGDGKAAVRIVRILLDHFGIERSDSRDMEFDPQGSSN